MFLSMGTFILMQIAPGDPVFYILSADELAVSQSDQAELRKELGFDQPIMVQYVQWVTQIIQLDFGRSHLTKRPVINELMSRFPATLSLALGGLVVMVLISVPMGMLAALHHRRPLDHLSRLVALLGASIPSFWLGLILIYIFSYRLNLFPTMGNGSFISLVLPSLTLGLGLAAVYARLLRVGLIDSLSQDYIRAARARGLGKGRILFHHALKSALMPVVTMFGMSIGHLIGGTVIVETLFSWPGMGKMVIDAIFQRDYPIIQGYVILTGIGVVIVNLFVDMSYRYLDPKIRFGRGDSN
jgi:ABC-type dipeptide/oligopeptide/nickel transport system permease component